MSDPDTRAPTGGDLQFDRADSGAAPGEITCGVCKQAVGATYYEVNGNVTCQRCRGHILAAWSRGSPVGRFAKALGLGLGAAVVGAGIYFAILAATGINFGLVAVLVGLFVGGAVRKGSGGRGGWRYQALAIFLTYTAVVVTDSSMIARELRKEAGARPETARATVLTPAGNGVGSEGRPAGAAVLILGLAAIVALAYAAPVLIGITSPLHLVIAGFALYEAWKLNRGVALRITGPYKAAAGTAPA